MFLVRPCRVNWKAVIHGTQVHGGWQKLPGLPGLLACVRLYAWVPGYLGPPLDRRKGSAMRWRAMESSVSTTLVMKELIHAKCTGTYVQYTTGLQ